MYNFNLDDQMLTRADNKKFAQNSVNAPTLFFNFGDSWQSGVSVARFTTSDGETHYDVMINRSPDSYGTVPCPYEIMTGESFYLSCKNVNDGNTITTNTVHIKIADNSFNEPSLTPTQTQSLEDALMAKLNRIEKLEVIVKQSLILFQQALYMDDSDEVERYRYKNLIDSLMTQEDEENENGGN